MTRIQTQHDKDGYPYRLVSFAGNEYYLSPYRSKLTIYREHGIVCAGGDYEYTLPDGRKLPGYTDDPFFVEQMREMWIEDGVL